MDLLDVKLSSNPLLSFMDYRMMFVVILGATRGLNVGIIAALLASINYVTNSLTNMNWQILFYNTQNWLPFATYFLVGAISGYTRDKKEDAIHFYKQEQEILENKYIFLNELYAKTLQNKDEFSSQIINYKDSYGKIYAMIKKLASTLPEKIFFEAVNVLEDILENTSVAIYSVEDNADFARLNVCSQPLYSKLSKSLRLSDYEKMKQVVEQHDTWINVEAIPNYPSYAAPILRENEMVGLITIYNITDHQMCQEYANKFSIVCGLIQEFMVRAIERDELIEKDRMVENTRILKPQYFNDILNVKQQMREKNFSEFVLVRMKNNDMPLTQLSNTLTAMLRHNDVIGQGENGDVYILLSQTNIKFLSIIENRMKEKNLYFDVVSSS